MKAMVLHNPKRPLRLEDLPEPQPGKNQVKLRVEACGICRTDLHVLDGELPAPKLPLVMGHQIVGQIVELGEGVHDCTVRSATVSVFPGWVGVAGRATTAVGTAKIFVKKQNTPDNLTRRDGEEFLPLAVRADIKPTVRSYGLPDVNRALDDLRNGAFTGSGVIVLQAN